MRKQLLVLGALFLFAAGPAAGADFSAGAAKRRTTPELKPGASVWMAGFANGRAATGVHDDLWTRCLAMSAGGKPVVVCSVDVIGLFFEDVKKIRDGARARLKRDVTRNARAVPVSSIEYREQVIEIPVTNQAYLMGSQAGVFKGRKPMSATKSTFTPVGCLKLSAGGKPILEAALVPGELYPELSVGGVKRDPGSDFPDAPEEKAIKRMMTAPVKMLFGLANDEIGYIIPKAQWDEQPPFTFGAQKRGYGEVNSVGPDAAPLIIDAFSRLVSNSGRQVGHAAPK